MKTTKLEAITKDLEKILADRDKEIKELEPEITKAENILSEIEPKLTAAATAHDLAEFQKLKNQKRDAADALEMLQTRYTQIVNESYITPARREAIEKELNDNFNAAEAAALDRLVKLADEMKQEGDALEDLLLRTNEALQTLKNDVCHDPHGPGAAISKWNTIGFANMASKHELYRLNKS